MADTFPFNVDELIGSITYLLKQNGDAREVAILAHSTPRVEPIESQAYEYGGDRGDSSYGGYGEHDTNIYWHLILEVNLDLYSAMTREDEEEVRAAEYAISRLSDHFFRARPKHRLTQVTIVPAPVAFENWRQKAKAYLAGQGITNQGRVRTDNIASRECDGLLFRSQPEINLYQALKKLGLTFAPLPVFLRGGEGYRRLEPDFVILKDGVMLVVEVDGDTYHRETPAEAHERLKILDHEGAKIERVKAEECDTPEKASVCAAKLVKILEKRVAQRG